MSGRDNPDKKYDDENFSGVTIEPQGGKDNNNKTNNNNKNNKGNKSTNNNGGNALLSQSEHKDELGTACPRVGLHNSFISGGDKTDKELEKLIEILSKAQANQTDYIETIKELYGKDYKKYRVESGLTEKQFKEKVGNNPSIINFSQENFWGKIYDSSNSHFIGYRNDIYIESYNKNKKTGSSVNDISPNSKLKFEDYNYFWYFVPIK